MTRAELATIIRRLFVAESESNKYIPDVKRQDWFYSDIRKAISMGIIQGDPEGYIHPNNYVTREEAVLMMARAFNIKPSSEIINISYADSDEISEWAKPEFLTFIRKHFIAGYTADNTIRPKENITRAEILTIIDRVANYNVGSSLYSTILNGNVLIRDTNANLVNVEIYGDLIIGESAARVIKLNNVSIHGNLVLYAAIDENENLYAVDGEVCKLYENRVNAEYYYSDNDYGINFSIPDGASVQNIKIDDKIDYSFKDLIVIDIFSDDEYYWKSLESFSEEEIDKQNYDSIFRKVEDGKIGIYPYILYSDNVTSKLLFIKRDNVIYKLLFLNVVSENIVDSVIANMEFTPGEQIKDHSNMIYENSKLCLKFSYRQGYVGVDDSYNTGNIFSGDCFFKLFIQVNKITDIGDYNIGEVKLLLKSLVSKDGKIISEQEKKVAGHDAIQFEIDAENDKIISLYVIIGNNLYNFIFTGDKDKVNILGKDIFQEIVNSMEF